jgi:hypothetical protein
MSKKTYNTKEISEMFNLSHPRLLQFRKGQKVGEYSFDPILEEGKDWYWSESTVVYTKTAVVKLQNRKIYRKRLKTLNDKMLVGKEDIPRLLQNKGEYSVQYIAKKYGITVQKIYSLRDVSTNKPIGYTNYLIENKDWKYVGGKVILLEPSKEKISQYANMLKEKKDIPKAKRIIILIGNKVFNIGGEDANAIIEIIKRKNKK